VPASPEEHERKLIDSFILKEKRDRWRTLLSPKRRADLTFTFAHHQDFDPKYATRIDVPEIMRCLREVKGLKECYLLSEFSDWDGVYCDLGQVEEVLIDFSGSYISCIPGELAIYKGEDIGQRYLLRRKPGGKV
jgi:hypothetical protein